MRPKPNKIKGFREKLQRAATDSAASDGPISSAAMDARFSRIGTPAIIEFLREIGLTVFERDVQASTARGAMGLSTALR